MRLLLAMIERIAWFSSESRITSDYVQFNEVIKVTVLRDVYDIIPTNILADSFETESIWADSSTF